jgi:simple sugar transport system permease protein
MNNQNVERSMSKSILRFVIDNSVTILFAIICIIGVIAAKEQPFMLVSLLLERMTRNTFLVLALLIPVVAGMGLNFSITIGAMAAQVAIITVAYLKIPTGAGLTLAFVISAPLSLILGKLIGKLLNKTRGQEMIASMITGFFADGIYQLIFLFFAGTIIPMTGEFVLSHGIGLRNTIDLGKNNGIAKAMDSLVSVPFFTVVIIAGIAIGLYYIGYLLSRSTKERNEGLYQNSKKLYKVLGLADLAIMLAMVLLIIFEATQIKSGKFDMMDGLLIVTYLLTGLTTFMLGYISEKPMDSKSKYLSIFYSIAGIGLAIYSYTIMYVSGITHSMKLLKSVKMSLFTAIVVVLFAVFNVIILKTKLGQTFKTVGQDKHIAEVSGIKVNKVRELAIMLSTLFAAWGQIIFIQNLGILNTYGSHKQIALFAVAALLIGGASVSKATIGQAFLGVLLFHTLFIVSPKAGLHLFGDAQLGEYFRTFVAYGVIGVSLGLHAWKTMVMKKNE